MRKAKSKFTPADSLGSLDSSEIAAYLTEIGDHDGAEHVLRRRVGGQGIFTSSTPYLYSGISLGYIEPNSTKADDVPISGVGSVAADKELIGRRIKITLDKFHIHSYPGTGTHRILCEFSGKNQVATESEELHFALKASARDDESASVSGHPVFMGVTVGSDGIAFEGRSINVSSDYDDVILDALDSSAFKSGLSLITTLQPALKPFTGLSSAVVKSALARKKNKQVHSFNLGLDFGSNATSARLRIGSYVVVQSDGGSWDWSDYVWNKNSLSLMSKKDGASRICFNYMVFGVSPFSSS